MESIVGKTIISSELDADEERLILKTADGSTYTIYVVSQHGSPFIKWVYP